MGEAVLELSDVAKGARRVRDIENMLNARGYRTGILSRSGQRRGARANSYALDGDLVAIAPQDSGWPHLIIEVGGRTKSVSESIKEMTAQPLPAGFVPVVVRQTASYPTKKWRWNLSSAEGFDSFEDLVGA